MGLIFVKLRIYSTQFVTIFQLCKFVVCTDAGLASSSNRKLNDIDNRAFISTLSVKKPRGYLEEWVLDLQGWQLDGVDKELNLAEIDEQQNKDEVFYKERCF